MGMWSTRPKFTRKISYKGESLTLSEDRSVMVRTNPKRHPRDPRVIYKDDYDREWCFYRGLMRRVHTEMMPTIRDASIETLVYVLDEDDTEDRDG